MSDFFESQRDQSTIKTDIVVKYFEAWANVMLNQSHVNHITYIDLFSGPGRYDDGSPSTPIRLLNKLINNEKYQQQVSTYFNDKEEEYINKLKKEINELPDINLLRYSPITNCGEVNDDFCKLFKERYPIPTLTFLDPWGYKGVSLKLIKSSLKNWGSECIIFFNYNRVNMDIDNKKVKKHMYALFGKKRTQKLVQKIKRKQFTSKENLILNEFQSALERMINCKTLKYKFRSLPGDRTSHYIIFATGSSTGHKIMKDIMSEISSDRRKGVGSFSYIKSKEEAEKNEHSKQLSLFDPIEQLKEQLLERFAGEELSVIAIYNKHNYGTKYVLKNYKTALKEMEKENIVQCSPPKENRPANTMADHVIVKFCS